jgi:hypothetical protein
MEWIVGIGVIGFFGWAITRPEPDNIGWQEAWQCRSCKAETSLGGSLCGACGRNKRGNCLATSKRKVNGVWLWHDGTKVVEIL